MDKEKVVVLFSGGLDSSSLVGLMLHEGYNVIPLSINYGQRHARELHAAQQVLSHFNLEHKHVVVDALGLRPLLKGSSQTDDVDVPEGHYAAPSMKITVVPNRNMILISLATALALSENADAVGFAAHAGDHYIYPDCRPNFIYRMGKVMEIASEKPIRIIAPFQNLSKGEILKTVRDAGADVPFGLTFSCYKGEIKHCGVCGTCVERKEAFQKAGITDPTIYVA